MTIMGNNMRLNKMSAKNSAQQHIGT